MDFQPAHFGFIDLLTQQAGLTVHFFALLAVDRNVVVGVGKLGVERCFFLAPLGDFLFQLLDFLDQRATLGEQCLTAGFRVGSILQTFSFLGSLLWLRCPFGIALAGQPGGVVIEVAIELDCFAVGNEQQFIGTGAQ